MKEKHIGKVKGKKKLPWTAPKRTHIKNDVSRVVAATTMY